MKKTVTLVELIIAIVLMGIVVLGAISFDLASRTFFKSSERKVNVVNDLTFVLEHLQKNIMNGKGTVDNPALVWDGATVLTISQDDGTGTLTGLKTVTYTFNKTAGVNQVIFTDTSPQVLTRRLEDFNGFDVNDFGFYMKDMTFLDNPAEEEDVRENPSVAVREQYFFPLIQSCT